MARVNLFETDITDGAAPAVCMCCGQPAVVQPLKTFRWNPGWVYILLFLVGLWPFIIVALLMSWQRRVNTPLCDRHAGYWRFRFRFVVGGLIALALAAVVMGLAIDVAGPNPSWAVGAWVGLAVA